MKKWKNLRITGWSCAEPNTRPSCSCSGIMGASFMRQVNIFTVETVTNRRKAVSIIEHLDSRWHVITLMARGTRSSARPKSTNP